MAQQLLCEGACNPTNAAVVQAIQQARIGKVDGRALSGHVLDRVRELRHTPHRWVRSDHELLSYAQIHACTVCGTERVYGRTDTRW